MRQPGKMRLYALALAQHITVGPGNMCSARNSQRNFIRLNHSYPWTAAVEQAVRALGRLVARLADEPAPGKGPHG